MQVYLSALSFSPSESLVRRLFFTQKESSVKLISPVKSYWDKCLITLEGHYDFVESVTFTNDSRLIASASADNTIRICNLSEAQWTKVLHCGAGQRSVAFSHDSSMIAAAGEDGTIRTWDVATGKSRWTLKGHTNAVTSVSFSHDGTLLASASHDKTIRIWDIDGNQKNVIPLFQSPSFVVFSHDSSLLAIRYEDDSIKIFNTITWETERDLIGHRSFVTSGSFSHDSKLFVSASKDCTARIWDLDGGESQALQHDSPLGTATLSHDATLVASGDVRGNVFLWDVNSKECIYKLEGHRGSVNSVAFSRDGALLASASFDRCIRVWDVKMGDNNSKQPAKLHEACVGNVAVSLDGSVAATNCYDGVLTIWNTRTGDCRQVLKQEGIVASLMAVSRGGKLLATGPEAFAETNLYTPGCKCTAD